MKPVFTRVLGATAFYGLLAVTVLSAIPYGTVEPWWIAVFECLVFALSLVALLEAFVSRTFRIEQLSLLAPLLLLASLIFGQSLLFPSAGEAAGVIGMSSSISADPFSSRLFAIKFLALIAAGVVVVRYTTNKYRLTALVYSLIFIGVASAVFGIMRKHLQQGPGFLLPRLPLDERGFAQFVNKNHFAFLTEMSLGLTLGLLVGQVSRHRRALLWLPVAALLWLALIYSNSRGGIIASLCELLFLALLFDPVRHVTREEARTTWHRFQSLAGGLALRVFLIVCLCALFAYGVGWVGGEQVTTNFEFAATDFSQQATYNNANTSRKEIWATTWRTIKAHPLAGIGFGGYWIAITRYHQASGEYTPQEAHNDYLELLASGGIVGALLVGWAVVAFLKKSRERLGEPESYARAARLGAVIGIFGVAFHSLVDFGLHVTTNALVFTMLVAIATARLGASGPRPLSTRGAGGSIKPGVERSGTPG